MSFFWRTKIVCFTSFKDQFNPRKWKKSLKVQNFEVVNSAICAIFTLCHCKNLAAECWSDFPPEKFYFEIFSKTNAVSITFGLRYIHGQSLKETDFPTRNAVDRSVKIYKLLPSITVKARFKRRATAVPNSIDLIKFDLSTTVARRLKPSRVTRTAV